MGSPLTSRLKSHSLIGIILRQLDDLLSRGTCHAHTTTISYSSAGDYAAR